MEPSLKQPNLTPSMILTHSLHSECLRKTTEWIRLLKADDRARINGLLQEIQNLWEECEPEFAKRQARLLQTMCIKAGIPFSHRFVEAHTAVMINNPLSEESKALEQQYALDPSNYSLALALALSMKKSGRDQRARQLLERVAASGYAERKMAIEYLKSFFLDVQHVS